MSYPAQYGKNLLLMSSLLSLIVGTISGLSQHKIKRLLAFSSVSHVGFLLLALSIYSVKSIESFIFYLVQYSITSLNIFLIILAMGYLINRFIYHSAPLPPRLPLFSISSYSYSYSYSYPYPSTNTNKKGQKGEKGLKFKETDLNYLSELKGQLNNNYILSFSLAVCLFSMAGVPPLMGFFGKQFVLYSSIEDGNIFLSFVAILVSVISASYYLKIVNYSFFSTGSGHTDTNINLFTSLSSFSSKTKSSSSSPATAIINEKEEEEKNLSSYSSSFGQKEESTLTILNINKIHSFIISFLTFTIILFFTQPSILLNCSSYIALTIFNI
jgi:NADH-ubiquinone oxidoreductase chain 2